MFSLCIYLYWYSFQFLLIKESCIFYTDYKKNREFVIYFYTSRSNEYIMNQNINDEHSIRNIEQQAEQPQKHITTNMNTTELFFRAMPGLILRVTNTLFKVVEKDKSCIEGGNKEISEEEIETEKQGPFFSDSINESQNEACMKCKIPDNEKVGQCSEKQSNKNGKSVPSTKVIALRTEDTVENKENNFKPMKSDRDLKENIEKLTKENKEIDEIKGPLNKQFCTICCDKIADAVLIPCGHGGLCFNCAKRIGGQNADCYLCRKVYFLFVTKNRNFGKYFKWRY